MARAMAARHRHHRAPPSHLSPPLSHTTAPLSLSLPLTLLSLSPSYPLTHRLSLITSTTEHPHPASRRVHDSHGRHLYPTSAISLSLSSLLFSSLLLLIPLTLPPFFLSHIALSLLQPRRRHILAAPKPLPYAAAAAAFGQLYLFHPLPLDSLISPTLSVNLHRHLSPPSSSLSPELSCLSL